LIDLQMWRQGSTDDRLAVAGEVDRALTESGFLMIGGHGEPPGARDELRLAARRFFALGEATKSRYATTVGGRGWVPPGREANAYYGATPDAALADLKESYTMGRDFTTGDPELDEDWFEPNRWPSEVPELEGMCRAYAEAVRTLYYELLDICAAALGLAPGWFTKRAQRSSHTFNINRYPPLTETGPPKDGQFRIAPHTDWGILTILDRQPGYGGLQVQAPDGSWMDAPYVPDAFTVNVGDLLARWTGDRWRSTRHRVLPPAAEAPDEDLISLIMFLEVDSDTVIRPLDPPVGGESFYPPVTAGDYLRERESAATVA
jgi:isopenicillin N synthase-like dioxygenase